MTEQGSPARRERNTVLAALELFRATGAPRVFYTMLLFLYVCENEGLTVSELAFVARMHVTTTARLVKAMAGGGVDAQDRIDKDRLGKDRPGKDQDEGGLAFESPLFEVRPSPEDHRLKFIHLAPEGRALRDRLSRLISAALPIEG